MITSPGSFLGTPFSIRESDRCLETTIGDQLVFAEWNFQYPRVGSLPRNRTKRRNDPWHCSLSVSASRIVASKRGGTRIRWHGVLSFQYPRVGSLPRNPADEFNFIRDEEAFSIRESDRCLETVHTIDIFEDVLNFQYPRVGSLPRNSGGRIRDRLMWRSFSIRESDRCLETSGHINKTRRKQHFQYPRVGSLPRNITLAVYKEISLAVSVSASRIVASKPCVLSATHAM